MLCVNSKLGGGVHGYTWKKNELDAAHASDQQRQGIKLVLDDMTTLSLYNVKLNGKGVNTGQLDSYLQNALKRTMRKEGWKETSMTGKNIITFAVGKGYAYSKATLLEMLEEPNLWRGLALTPPAPLPPAITWLDCTGRKPPNEPNL